MPTYLALDQALANTGWAVLSVNLSEPAKLRWGTFTTSATEELRPRVDSIVYFTLDMLTRYQPERFYTEKVFVNRSQPGTGGTSCLITETAVHTTALLNNVPYVIISANGNDRSSWRHTLNLGGGKNVAKNYMMERLGIKPHQMNQHAADACAILLTGLILEGIIEVDIPLVADL